VIVGLRLASRPKIAVYEYGIGLRDRDDEKSWRWEHITRWDGERVTHSYEGIPTIRYGANHFYAGSERLFSISAMRDRADQLANYIFSKLAQVNGLPKDLKAYHDGHSIRYDGVNISRTGLGGNKQSVRWEEMEMLDFKNNQLRVKRYTDRKLRKFGYVSPIASYSLMALLDRTRQTDFLARKQEELLRSRGQIWWAHGKKLALVTLIVSPILIGVILYLQYGEQSGKQRYAGLIALTAQYGSEVSIACSSSQINAYTRRHGKLTEHHYLIIDATDGENPHVHESLQAAQPDDERAVSADDLTTVVCLWSSPMMMEACAYGDTKRQRYNGQYFLSVIDVTHHVVIAEDTITGTLPPTCPKAAPDADLYGFMPTSAEFIRWLHQSTLPPGSQTALDFT
jgi:hypothetical protein